MQSTVLHINMKMSTYFSLGLIIRVLIFIAIELRDFCGHDNGGYNALSP
jgi:hypothetical protein